MAKFLLKGAARARTKTMEGSARAAVAFVPMVAKSSLIKVRPTPSEAHNGATRLRNDINQHDRYITVCVE